MKVHLIKASSIEDYVIANVASRVPLNAWLTAINTADWANTMDMRQSFPSCDFLGGGSKRVIFHIGGNNYRLICSYMFGVRKVHLYVKWIGSHAEYTRLCNDNKQYTISIF
jgi:mRNA interferase HigB